MFLHSYWFSPSRFSFLPPFKALSTLVHQREIVPYEFDPFRDWFCWLVERESLLDLLIHVGLASGPSCSALGLVSSSKWAPTHTARNVNNKWITGTVANTPYTNRPDIHCQDVLCLPAMFTWRWLSDSLSILNVCQSVPLSTPCLWLFPCCCRSWGSVKARTYFSFSNVCHSLFSK